MLLYVILPCYQAATDHTAIPMHCHLEVYMDMAKIDPIKIFYMADGSV